jgi:hypothetical protein
VVLSGRNGVKVMKRKIVGAACAALLSVAGVVAAEAPAHATADAACSWNVLAYGSQPARYSIRVISCSGSSQARAYVNFYASSKAGTLLRAVGSWTAFGDSTARNSSSSSLYANGGGEVYS